MLGTVARETARACWEVGRGDFEPVSGAEVSLESSGRGEESQAGGPRFPTLTAAISERASQPSRGATSRRSAYPGRFWLYGLPRDVIPRGFRFPLLGSDSQVPGLPASPPHLRASNVGAGLLGGRRRWPCCWSGWRDVKAQVGRGMKACI